MFNTSLCTYWRKFWIFWKKQKQNKQTNKQKNNPYPLYAFLELFLNMKLIHKCKIKGLKKRTNSCSLKESNSCSWLYLFMYLFCQFCFVLAIAFSKCYFIDLKKSPQGELNLKLFIYFNMVVLNSIDILYR